MSRRVIISVFGKVQGVFFRDRAQKKAKSLNLTGWVKNEDSGEVKILAEGEDKNLIELIDWASSGPTLARIDKVEVKWEEEKKEFKDFEVRY